MADRVFVPGEDDAAVLGLRARVWGADHPHTDPAYFKWLFRDSPAGTGTGVIYEKDGATIGFAGICAREAVMDGRRFRIAHGLDFMVDPDVSGVLSGRAGVRILQRHVQEAEKQGFDANLNYPNDNSHRMLVSKRVRYEPVLAPALYIRPISPWRGTADGAPSLARRVALTAAAGYGRLRGIGISREAGIAEIDRCDERFDALWSRLCADGRLRFCRDARTLDWRYRQNPVYRYRILAAERDGALDGYIVTSKREIMDTSAELVCDLAVAHDAPGTAARLLRAAAGRARRDGVALLATQALSAGPTAAALRRTGFLRVPERLNPKPFRMIATAYTDAGKDALIGGNWSFAWGDMDVV
ncbi:hypothetical protein D6850_07655 [Roseovarius spongiae]|uniref:GNAT family N-acetyltransferase n=1 Tax=Roseovarius spongiae TaxID=2320272 RepID=A0A3A8B5G5_9RHOB|nr:hypothetical protein [Roseovarius spongiae]RKF14746.1 hypothetical protein D6850_07655 [Roseovarius spongiae]